MVEKTASSLGLFYGPHTDPICFTDNINGVAIDLPATRSSIYKKNESGEYEKIEIWMISAETFNSFIRELYKKNIIDENIQVEISGWDPDHIIVPYPKYTDKAMAHNSIDVFLQSIITFNERHADIIETASAVLNKFKNKL